MIYNPLASSNTSYVLSRTTNRGKTEWLKVNGVAVSGRIYSERPDEALTFHSHDLAVRDSIDGDVVYRRTRI